ncbi:MAG TPA: NIPSNAP family protein [Terriglobales bacterium]|nr:NIPSNAP family protein [Terriglobales bacterium]
MATHHKSVVPMFRRGIFKGQRIVCVTALVSFAAGSLITARMAHVTQARAESNRVFELMIYHAMPGKEPALESLFREVSKLQAKHGLEVVGYWVPNDDPAWSDTFIYLVAHSSRDEAKKNWRELHADPQFPPYRQSAEPLLRKADDQYQVDEVYMRPTEYSAMK